MQVVQIMSVWMAHRDFVSWAKSEWQWNENLAESLNQFLEKLLAWNKDTFENIFQKKKRCMLQLEGAQRALARSNTAGLLRLEERLRKERKEILLQEKMLWRQKSRIEWIKEGDCNTRFFHTTLVRRRNMAESLQDDQGEWVTDKAKLKDMALSFFTNLFTAEPCLGEGVFIRGRFPSLSEAKSCELEKEYSLEEM